MESRAVLKDISRDFETGKPILSFMIDSFAPEADLSGNLRLTVRRWKESRSLDANKLLWACIGKLAAAMRADKWDIYLLMLKRYGKYTYICVKPEAVESIKKQWREVEEIGEIDINGQTATQLLCYYGSSTLDTQEFSVLLDGVISEMKEAGIPTPTDEEIERSLELYGKRV